MSQIRRDLKARPTTYNGIKMRSRLEAQFAAALDELGVTWEYEPRAFADERRQYLPDFRIERDDGATNVYVEVKPVLSEEDEKFNPSDILAQMRVIYRSEPGCLLAIATPALSPFVLMEWDELSPLDHLNRQEHLETDDNRWVRVRLVGLAAWFKWSEDDTPELYPLASLGYDNSNVVGMCDGAGPVPFDWKWKG